MYSNELSAKCVGGDFISKRDILFFGFTKTFIQFTMAYTFNHQHKILILNNKKREMFKV